MPSPSSTTPQSSMETARSSRAPRGADPPHQLPRDPPPRAKLASGSKNKASSSATASRPSPNTWRHLETWYGLTASARSITPSTRAFSPSRSPVSSIMPEPAIFLDTTFLPLVEKLPASLSPSSAHRPDRCRHMPQTSSPTRSPTRNGSPRSTAISPGRLSTRILPPASAIPPAPRAIRRASSTRIAPTCCIR